MPVPAAPVPLEVPFSEWHIEVGDRLVVDTKENEGYLIHDDGRYVSFPVATGQHRGVCYIGRCYDATTPTRTWQVKSKDIKGDRITFGPSGRFLRLYKDGEQTAYGIHEYKYEDRMFDDQPRFKSMGCVIVKKAMMDVLEQTYAVNEGMLHVVTQYGVAAPVETAFGVSGAN
ncbi:MAG: L,D-transpeptidase [Candidatus Peribacteraceae bacterium]|nr:L,D-transpeptidase [Candidatus Peribacteraceae bacterium]MDD5075049.1 L,D-transpeptidase [Candidatus Peribacteraceae bacterium]